MALLTKGVINWCQSNRSTWNKHVSWIIVPRWHDRKIVIEIILPSWDLGCQCQSAGIELLFNQSAAALWIFNCFYGHGHAQAWDSLVDCQVILLCITDHMLQMWKGLLAKQSACGQLSRVFGIFQYDTSGTPSLRRASWGQTVKRTQRYSHEDLREHCPVWLCTW